ncbi:MAG: helix-turn-helix domain-containing protein [Aeromicrobium sp.]
MRVDNAVLFDRARAAFFDEDIVPPSTVVRPVILESWMRSRTHGLRAEEILPIKTNHDHRHNKLHRMTRELVDSHMDLLRDMACAVTLTAADGCIIENWVLDPALERRVEHRRMLPGFSLAEPVIGSAGAGIALETGSSVMVYGPEHFTVDAAEFTSASSAIRHPRTKHLVGAISLTCDIRDSNPLMLHWIKDQARTLERRIAHESSDDQIIFDTFMKVIRDTRHPVICLDDRTLVSNAAAARLMSGFDQTTLWEMASGTVQTGESTTFEIDLPDSVGTVPVTCRPIADGDKVIGATLQIGRAAGGRARPGADPTLHLSPQDAEVLPGLAGRSSAWLEFCHGVRRAVDRRANLLVVGDTGTGKSAVLRELVRDEPGHGVLDSRQALSDPAAWDERLESLLGAGSTAPVVTIDDIQVLTNDQLGRLHHLMGEATSRPAAPVVLASITWQSGASHDVHHAIEQWHGRSVRIPDLRERLGDLPHLLKSLTTQHNHSHNGPTWTPDVVQTLSRVPWPANVSSLAGQVATILRRHRGPYIRSADLPIEVQALAARRQLSGLEQMAAHAIITALKEAGGNKKLAADSLGIARSTLYRKLRTLGMDLSASTY